MEPPFGEFEEDADDPVELLLGEVLDGDPPREIDVAVGAEREAGAVQVVIAAQQPGVKGGQTIGETDEFGFQPVADSVHVHDLHATILNQFGLDHTKLTYRFQGRDFRLTDVAGNVVTKLLS